MTTRVRSIRARRLVLLSVLATFLGIAGGLAGYAFLRIIALMLNLTLMHRAGWQLPPLDQVHPGWELLPIAAAGGLVVAFMARWEPMIRGHGVPEAMDAVLTKRSRITPRAAFAKPVATALAIGTGAPFGAEGPIIVTGGALGSLIGQLFPVSPSERKILLASGAAAGMSAIFGAPLGAVLLAIELLLFEFSIRAFVPLVIASVLADEVHIRLIGPGPLFNVPPQHVGGFVALPFFALLGLLGGVMAIVVSRGLFSVEHLFERLPVPRFWHPVIGAVAFALIGLAVPRALGVGYDVVGVTLASKLTAGTMAAVFAAKLAAWWIAMGSGTSGSSLAPILLIGAAFGGTVGAALAPLVPSSGITAGTFALVGMGAIFGAAAGAPFTSMVLVFEMTRDFHIVLPLMLATVLANLVYSRFLQDTIMTQKLTKRGLRVATEFRVDPLARTLVSQVMTTVAEPILNTATVSEARGHVRHDSPSAYPIVDEDGRCIGTVAVADLFDEDAVGAESVLTVAQRDVPTVRSADSLEEAVATMVASQAADVPVLEGGEVVGMCTARDVLRAREVELERERVEPGWVTRMRRKRGGSEPPADGVRPSEAAHEAETAALDEDGGGTSPEGADTSAEHAEGP